MDTPAGYGPSSVPLPTRSPPLPFLIKLVVAFLGADALGLGDMGTKWEQAGAK